MVESETVALMNLPLEDVVLWRDVKEKRRELLQKLTQDIKEFEQEQREQKDQTDHFSDGCATGVSFALNSFLEVFFGNGGKLRTTAKTVSSPPKKTGDKSD